MGSSSKQTQATQTTAPYAPAQPYLQQALGLAGTAADNTYNGTGVAGMDPLVTQGQNTAIANANTGAVGNIGTQAISNVGTVVGNNGLTAPQSGAITGIGSALTNAAGTTDAVKSFLTPYANGSMIGSNPYLDAVLAQADQNTADSVNRQFSAAGRYGSGAQSDALGRAIGNVNTTARLGQYNTDVGNMLTANNSLASANNSGFSNSLSGLGAVGNIGQQGFTNTMNAAAAAPSLVAAQGADANVLTGIGSQNMAYQQQLIDAANQNPWLKAGNLAQISGGIAGLGGTQNGTSTTTQQNDPFSTLLGGLLAGTGAAKNVSGFKLFG